jgi:acyl-CoA reductase-like NAD-dependent aldehyde dehydrogenase
MTDAARHDVDGELRVEGDLRQMVDVYSGQDFGACHCADEALAEEAIQVARRAFERTNRAPAPRLRAAVLNELADAVAARRDEIAHAIAPENGKVLAHCLHETNAAISKARYYAGLERAIFGRVSEVDEGKQ